MNEEILEKTAKKVISEWNNNITRNKESYNFAELTLSTGLPGVILMLSELKNGEEAKIYNQKINEYIEYIVDKISAHGLLTGSLYSGASGIALSILQLKEEDKRIHNLINSLNRYIDYFVNEKINYFDLNDLAPTDYDVIEGLSGILAYLLLIEDKSYDETKMLIVNFLSDLVKKEDTLISLYVKSKNQMSEAESETYPLGCLNMGLAHGLAGVGSIIAYAHMKGFSNQLSLSALQNIISIYEKFELEKEGQFLWKDGIVIDELKENRIITEPSFIRDAWCYGSPGISLLYLYAGLVQKSEYLVNKAKNILEASMNRKLGVDSDMLCHGYAGLIEICLLFKRLWKTKRFDSYIENFKNNGQQIIKQYRNDNGSGFLEGVSGCILVLLEFEQPIRHTYWRQALFIFDDFLSGGKVE